MLTLVLIFSHWSHTEPFAEWTSFVSQPLAAGMIAGLLYCVSEGSIIVVSLCTTRLRVRVLRRHALRHVRRLLPSIMAAWCATMLAVLVFALDITADYIEWTFAKPPSSVFVGPIVATSAIGVVLIAVLLGFRVRERMICITAMLERALAQCCPRCGFVLNPVNQCTECGWRVAN